MGYNVLLVDDSSIVRKMVRKVLGLTDVEINEIYEAENGKVALELMEDKWVDLVLLDINMPVMNGMEFIEKLRQNEMLRDTPVVVMSTDGSKERRQVMEDHGVTTYLKKPVSQERIAEVFATMLGDKQ